MHRRGSQTRERERERKWKANKNDIERSSGTGSGYVICCTAQVHALKGAREKINDL